MGFILDQSSNFTVGYVDQRLPAIGHDIHDGTAMLTTSALICFRSFLFDCQSRLLFDFLQNDLEPACDGIELGLERTSELGCTCRFTGPVGIGGGFPVAYAYSAFSGGINPDGEKSRVPCSFR